jgi:hypothetical protein
MTSTEMFQTSICTILAKPARRPGRRIGLIALALALFCGSSNATAAVDLLGRRAVTYGW